MVPSFFHVYVLPPWRAPMHYTLLYALLPEASRSNVILCVVISMEVL